MEGWGTRRENTATCCSWEKNPFTSLTKALQNPVISTRSGHQTADGHWGTNRAPCSPPADMSLSTCGIRYGGGKSQFFSFDQVTVNTSTNSHPGLRYVLRYLSMACCSLCTLAKQFMVWGPHALQHVLCSSDISDLRIPKSVFCVYAYVKQRTYFLGRKMLQSEICILLKHHADQWKLSYFEYLITSQIHLLKLAWSWATKSGKKIETVAWTRTLF